MSYFIPSISKNFVRTSLQQLSTNKATGLDDLSSYFLKIAASSISPSLTAVFNLSIFLVFSPIFGKLLKSLHCIKTVRCFTDPIIAQYQFWLLSQKFLSAMCTKRFTIFFPNTSCCWIRSLVSVVLVRVSLLSPIFLITF